MSDQQQTESASAFGDESQQQSEARQVEARPLPGALLAAERRAKGWSVDYVASHLKLATRQIHALEEDRYDALPSAVIIRGFIRIYAKMLGVDATILIALLPADTTRPDAQIMPSRALSTPFSESSLPLRGRNELPVARLAWLAVGVLVIAGIFSLSRYGVWDEIKNSSLAQRLHLGVASAAADGSTEGKNAGAAGADLSSDAGNNESSPTVESTLSAQPELQAGSTTTLATPASAATPATPAPDPVMPAAPIAQAPSAPAASPALQPVQPLSTQATSPAQAPAVAAAGASPLQLTMSQDSWVEIRRADKSVVVSSILKAGTTESFDINGPVSMVVGNVAGVGATLRGQPLDLVSNAGSNVSRLTLK